MSDVKPRRLTAAEVVGRLKDDGDFDALRRSIVRKVKDNEVAADTCVYKRVLRKPSGEPKDVLKDAASLPRTRSVRCANCKHPEAAFFQAPTRGEQAMTLYFICCNPSCGHRWRD